MENEAEVLALAIVLALIVASVVTWLACLAGLSSGALLRYAPRKKVPWGLVDIALAMVLIIAASLVAQELLVKWAGIDPAKPLAELSAVNRATVILVSSLSMMIGVLLSLGLVWLKNRPTLDDYGIGFRNIGRDVWIGAVTFLLLAAPVYAIQYLLVEVLGLPSEHPLIELVKRNPDPRFFVVTFVAAVVFAPLTEEFLFRVLLQGWLERLPGHRGHTNTLLLGGADVPSMPPEDGADENQPRPDGLELPRSTDRPAGPSVNPYAPPQPVPHRSVEPIERPPSLGPVVVSSLVFAAVHISHGVDPIPLFVLALGLGFVYRQTHRVLPSIIAHLLFNAFSLAMLLVEVYGVGR